MRWFRKTVGGRHEIGILFDIGALGGFYGREAYRIVLAGLDPQRMAGCSFHDGDTEATLYGGANIYCIAVQAPDPQTVAYVRDVFGARTDEGLLPPDRRFLEGDVIAREPLVHAADVDKAGRLVGTPDTIIYPEYAEGTAWTVVDG
ncbi:hypothetical protein ABZZ80_19635 [Streptomyces sp. NPDC006356]